MAKAQAKDDLATERRTVSRGQWASTVLGIVALVISACYTIYVRVDNRTVTNAADIRAAEKDAVGVRHDVDALAKQEDARMQMLVAIAQKLETAMSKLADLQAGQARCEALLKAHMGQQADGMASRGP
jgi:hypothetical protein